MVESDVYHHGCELGWHHTHLHATSWFLEVYDFVQIDWLVSLHVSVGIAFYFLWKGDDFISLILDVFVGVVSCCLFESFDGKVFFSLHTEFVVLYSQDFGGLEYWEEFLFCYTFSSFDDSSELV